MRLRTIKALRGPNIWSTGQVLEAWVELGRFHGVRPDAIEGFVPRLLAWLPTMAEPRCSPGEWAACPAATLWQVARELQTLAWKPVGPGASAATSEPGVVRVAIPYLEEALARECLASALAMLQAAASGEPFDAKAEQARLRKLAQEVGLGPSTAAIVAAAHARGIPTRRLSPDCSLIQLGHGAAQRRIWTAETDRTGAIAETIAKDKDLTRTLLQSMGVPVPEGRPVADAEDAWAAAEEIGTAIVVKPQDGNHGRGVATDLTTREQVLAAFANARAESERVIVERYAPGDDYRLLVIGDRLIAAARRSPAQVLGDGRSTVAQLVDEVNQDPRRGDEHATVLSKIHIDAVALMVLAEQGYTPESIPPAGTLVLIRRNANLSTGGTATDVTDEVHPEIAACAVDAARAIGLDIAGVDIVARDIGRPLQEQGGVIVEVNAGPGLRMHLEPSAGRPRPVGEAIIDMVFPDGRDGRIPIAAVTGVNGKTTTTRFLAHLLREAGKSVGMTCTDGVYINDRRIEAGDCSGPGSAGKVLLNPKVEAAVLETARGGLLRAGLGFDRCDVAVVTNIGEGDHLGMAEIQTVEDLARVKRITVEAVSPTGAAVLNADDPLVVAMAPYCRGSVVFFAQDPDHPVVAAHRAGGGRAVIVRHGEIVLAEGARETGLSRLADVPLTHGGRIGFQVENTLAAAGAAWALGLGLDAIRDGLETFGSAIDTVPGRFNLLEVNGATIMIDYGHNISALRALVEAIEPLPHPRRSIVYSVAGDRRDEDMVRQGQILAGAFDRVYLYEDSCLRGRAPGEITALLRRGLAVGPRVREFHEHHEAMKAVEASLRELQAGDLLIVQADEVDATIAFIKNYLGAEVPGREVDLAEMIEVAESRDAVTAGRSWDEGPR